MRPMRLEYFAADSTKNREDATKDAWIERAKEILYAAYDNDLLNIDPEFLKGPKL